MDTGGHAPSSPTTYTHFFLQQKEKRETKEKNKEIQSRNYYKAVTKAKMLLLQPFQSVWDSKVFLVDQPSSPKNVFHYFVMFAYQKMEAGGVVQWRCTKDLYNIRYNPFMGDGDSTAYSTVDRERPYSPTVVIKKEECVNHITKRMGTNLRRLIKEYKGKKT